MYENLGVLTICRKTPVGVTVASIMVRNFPNSTDQLDEIGLTIYLSGVSSANCAEKAWKWRIHSNGKEFSAVPFRWKKRSTSEGTPQFPYRIYGKTSYFWAKW